MTHTITQSKHRITTPTGLYEANYRRLIRLVPELRALAVNDDYCLSLSKIVINVLEQYKYTSVVSLRQLLQASVMQGVVYELQTLTHLNSIDMELRICHDARLVEVIGYQGKSPIQSANVYPNKHMLQIDEKRQLNLFLKDVLENSLKTEYHHREKKLLEQIKHNTMGKFILYLFTCIVWQISVASAGDLEQGIRFFEQKNYAQAKELWQPLAKKGDARAQYNLALLLYKEILSAGEGGANIQKNLRRHKAGKYLAMSRSEGLVDGYFVTIPAFEALPVVIDDPVSWLRQQQKNNYTLQLVTGNSQKSMQKMHQKLLSSQLLEQPHNLYIQKVEKNKQEKIVIQYVLIYGIFKTYQEAKDEAEKLPESIQKSNPWIRQIGVIQSMVNIKQKNKET